MAGDTTVRDPRQRSDAAADPGRARVFALACVARALADTRCARGRLPRRRDQGMAGARLQPARRSPCTVPRNSRLRQEGWPDDLTSLPGVGPYTAAAIRNQAYGEQILPVDTNVARIQERTGHAFRPGERCRRCSTSARPSASRACRAAGPARWPQRARRGDAGTSRRGSSRAFEGSFRQRRATLLRLVAAEARPVSVARPGAVNSLLRDGLVEQAGQPVRLPPGR